MYSRSVYVCVCVCVLQSTPPLTRCVQHKVRHQARPAVADAQARQVQAAQELAQHTACTRAPVAHSEHVARVPLCANHITTTFLILCLGRGMQGREQKSASPCGSTQCVRGTYLSSTPALPTEHTPASARCGTNRTLALVKGAPVRQQVIYCCAQRGGGLLLCTEMVPPSPQAQLRSMPTDNRLQPSSISLFLPSLTHTHTHTYTGIHTHTCARTHMCTHTHTNTRARTQTHVHAHKHTHLTDSTGCK